MTNDRSSPWPIAYEFSDCQQAIAWRRQFLVGWIGTVCSDRVSDGMSGHCLHQTAIEAPPSLRDNGRCGPTVLYHFCPAFLEYPGSTHLSFETARDIVVDIVRSLANYGPHRFYVLNTGVSTMRPLEASARVLAKDGILLRYTDIIAVGAEATKRVEKQVRGTHADEIETSMMLYMAPERVNMSLAVTEDNPDVHGPLTRKADGNGLYSASGVWGDATLAKREKGQVVVEASVVGIVRDIGALRSTDLPSRD